MRLPSRLHVSSGAAAPMGTDTAKGTGGCVLNCSATLAKGAADVGSEMDVAFIAFFCDPLPGGRDLANAKATRVPALGRESRNPSAISCSYASRTVPRAMPSELASCRLEGRRSPAFKLPARIASRNACVSWRPRCPLVRSNPLMGGNSTAWGRLGIEFWSS